MTILVTAEYSAEKLVELKRSFGTVLYQPWTTAGKGMTDQELASVVATVKADALITELDTVSQKTMDARPLSFIGDCRGAPVNVDMEAAKARKIPVFTTPARNANAVAELVVGLILTYYRNLYQALPWTKNGKWINPPPDSYYKFQGKELNGKNVGIVGFGAIGRLLSTVLSSFGCTVRYYDPYYSGKSPFEKVEDLATLFRESDVVSLHVPVTPKTVKMVNAELLNQLRPDALFVNSARAALVDCDCLYELLRQKKIGGAVLDVFTKEPPSEFDQKLIALDNVVASPHIAGATFDVVRHQSEIINRQIFAWSVKEKSEQ